MSIVTNLRCTHFVFGCDSLILYILSRYQLLLFINIKLTCMFAFGCSHAARYRVKSLFSAATSRPDIKAGFRVRNVGAAISRGSVKPKGRVIVRHVHISIIITMIFYLFIYSLTFDLQLVAA